MKFQLYRNYGALNSPPVFDAFAQGIKNIGHEIVDQDGDIAVIWSVLWNGRMAPNKTVYENFRKLGKPVVIIEVGNFFRGKTWRLSINNINRNGIFGNDQDLDLTRDQKLGVSLKNLSTKRKEQILIACQHSKSLQWEGQPSMEEWVKHTINEVKRFTKRKIVVRPHPRSLLRENFVDAVVELPKKLEHTYDDFNIDYNYHCVINFNSGPAVQAAINGVPTICDTSSLAYPVSEKWENLENPKLADREEWFIRLCHTEWTIEEIQQGIPQQRLISNLKNFL